MTTVVMHRKILGWLLHRHPSTSYCTLAVQCAAYLWEGLEAKYTLIYG